jgi:hypothetical protein
MSDNLDLFRRGYDVLSSRQRWEDRQRLWYLMRHQGIRRKNKPFPTAADLHLAIIDEMVTKLKPFTMAQLTGQDRLVTFCSRRQQLAETTDAAAEFFSYEIKERSNLLDIMETVVDTLWLRGRGIVKSYVDPYNGYRLIHENVDPLFLLMNDVYNDFEDADEWIHVRQIPVMTFKRDRRWCADFRADDGEINGDTMKKLSGGADAANRLHDVVERVRGERGRDFDRIQSDKEYREGVTHSASNDTIIVWEHYVRTVGGIMVYPYCPLAMDVVIRKPYGVPYKVDGKVSANFFSFTAEVKDEGWYSPRGMGDKLSDMEIYASKLWNAKADAITFFNTPMLTSENPIANPANYRQVPGEYIPGNVRAVQYGTPAISFDQEIAFARGEAEQRAQMPDLGLQKPNAAHKGEKQTAREVSAKMSLAQVGTNHAGTLFRKQLTKLLRFDWALCLAYRRTDLTYFVSDNLQTLPVQALHDEYLILPGGSTDDWDRSLRLQKAQARLEMLGPLSNTNKDELVRDVLAADDARLVKRILIPTQQKTASEAEDEATEISTMMTTHYPAPVLPGEDHLTRVKVLLQFLTAQGQKGVAVDPLAKQRLGQHLGAHLQYLKQLQPQAYKQVVQMMQQLERAPMPAPAAMGLRPMAGRPAPRPLPSVSAPMPATAGAMNML